MNTSKIISIIGIIIVAIIISLFINSLLPFNTYGLLFILPSILIGLVAGYILNKVIN